MRIKWIDCWRGLLITLVVMGHVVGEEFHYTHDGAQTLMDVWYKIIYSFHMPAFFMLAGIVWSDKGDDIIHYVVGKFKRLMVPYFFWGIVSAGIYVALSSFVPVLFSDAISDVYVGKGIEDWWMPLVSILHAGGWPNGDGFQCNSVLWFLPVLFSVEIIFYFLHRHLPRRSGLIFVGLGCLLFQFYLARRLPLLPFGLRTVPLYMPFFICGNLIQPILKGKDEIPVNRRCIVLSVCVLVSYCVVCWSLPNKVITRYSAVWSFQFCLLALIGSFLSMAIAMLVKSDILACLGKASLAIMLLHKFALILLLNVLHVTTMVRTSGAIFSAFLCVLVTAFVVGLSYVGFYVSYKLAPRTIGIWK